MAEIKPLFRLRYLFSPSYMAARLTEIASFSDAFNRAARVPIYIYFLVVNGCYSASGLIKRFATGSFFSKTISTFIQNSRLIKRFATGSSFSVSVPPASKERLGGLLVKMREGKRAALRLLSKLRSAAEDRLRDIALRKGIFSIRPTPPDATVTADIRPPEGMRPERPMRALWFIHPACNYGCDYCWQSHSQNFAYPVRGVEEYARCWERFNRLYGPAVIEIIGGEPFILPNITEILSALSQENSLSIVTNLSWEPEKIIGKLKPDRISLLASYHPDQDRSLKRFIEKTDILRRNGFPVTVCLVAFPPDLPKMPYWLDAFYRKGIFAIILPFKGKWRGRSYPQAHTPLEKKFITGANQFLYMYPGSIRARRSVKGLSFATDLPLSGVSPRGRLCNTGLNYCRILLNGEIVRCGQCECVDGTGVKSELLGNLFEMDFHLPDKAAPCVFDECECLGENDYIAGGPLGTPNSIFAAQRTHTVGDAYENAYMSAAPPKNSQE